MSSCNGLILETEDDHFCITNPATKQHFTLPTNTTQTQIPAIAYAAATKEYKVVCAVYNNHIHSDSQPDGIAILTVGVDMDWTRRVDIQHLSLEDKGLLRHRPLATQGFVHWATTKGTEWVMNGEAEEEYVLTLNVEKEAITRSRIPPCLRRREGEERLLYYYLSTGSRLSVLVGGRTDGLSWEVWMMESETGEWTHVTSVDLEAQKCVVLEGIMPVPVGWSKFGKVLVFSSGSVRLAFMHTGYMFAYNVSFCWPRNLRECKNTKNPILKVS